MRQLPAAVVLREYPSETVADIFHLLLSSQGVIDEQLYTADDLIKHGAVSNARVSFFFHFVSC